MICLPSTADIDFEIHTGLPSGGHRDVSYMFDFEYQGHGQDVLFLLKAPSVSVCVRTAAYVCRKAVWVGIMF